MCSSPKERLEKYTVATGQKVTKFLGDGTDGYVAKSDRNTAIKAFLTHKNYLRELRCYQRLTEQRVWKIAEFAIPRLVDYHDSLWIIEMDIVTPPCILDFGKAYLDHPPDFSPETWRDHYEKEKDIWEDKFPKVQSLMGILKSLGILYYDTSPKNIQFPDDWKP